MNLLTPNTINAHHQTLLCSPKCYTNYFTHQNEQVYGQITPKSLVFLSENSSFYSLYFTSVDLSDLEEIFTHIMLENITPKGTISQDIALEMIHKGELPPMLEKLLKKQFTLQSIYEKMTLYIKNLKPKLKNPKNPQYCTQNKLDFLYQNLCESFDVRFDHLPSKETLREYIQKNQVLIKEKNEEISAYCIYSTKGKTSHFNYLKNINADGFEMIELIEEFYQEMKRLNIEHIYLWVDILSNIRVKNMHLKYGYQSSNVFNYAFIKSNTRNTP